MKIIEHIENATGPKFSYEIVPPPRGKSIKVLTDIVQKLVPFDPPWIDVTAHSAGASYIEKKDGTIERKITKKRPGTIGICGVIQNRFKIDTVVHLLCNGFTKEETEDALIELQYLGIHNVLALKGDGLNYNKKVASDRSINIYASDLVEQIAKINAGIYIDDDLQNADTLNFGIGVAGYPEKHFESPNLKTDIMWLKNKVMLGADYVTSQMFYNNQFFYDYCAVAKQNDVDVPIIPGLKILKSVKQLQTLTKNFHITFPDKLVDEVMNNQKHVKEIGMRHALEQATDLLENGINNIHFYIMNDTDSVIDIVKSLQKL